MEASEAANDVADTSESALSTFDDVVAADKSQQPIEADDGHGTVTPRSAPPAGPHSGIDPVSGQATVPPAGSGGDEGDSQK